MSARSSEQVPVYSEEDIEKCVAMQKEEFEVLEVWSLMY
jgi:hypothetical protein